MGMPAGAAAQPRILLVLRHAKAAPGEPGGPDVERPLTGRGRRDAAQAGRWLLAAGLLPDLVRCSDAVRTRQTWRQVRSALGPAAARAQVSFEPRIYHADAHELLRLVRESPEEAGVVLLVGHNPAAHQLAADLAAEPGLAFPTSALAVVRLAGRWRDAAAGGCELAGFWSPSSTL